MKPKYPAAILFLLLLCGACSLDEVPPSSISPASFYKTAGDAVAAVNAIYDITNEIGQEGRNLIIMGDIPSDDMNLLANNNDRIQIWSFQTVPTNGIVAQSWQVLYQGVNRANAAIERIPAINMNENLKSRLVGEAKFLRAFYYFYLVRWYGGVPLVVTETKTLNDGRGVARASADEVYAQIIRDLEDAEGALPDRYTGTEPELGLGRATAGAAKGVLTQVYLTRKEYAKARDKAKEIIDNAGYGYALWDTYADVFKVGNENGRESVFEIQFVGGGVGQGNGLITYMAPENSPVTGRGFGSFFPTPDLYDSYRPGDKRKELYINSYVNKEGQTIQTFPHFNKYVDPAAATFPQGNNNFPYLRYADILLMFAEADNEVNGPTPQALAAANQIRRRAFGLPLNAPSAMDFTASLGKDGFRQGIWEERRWEFAAEGQRWFDLVRTDRLVPVLSAKGKTNVQEKHKVFPIPSGRLT